MFAALKNFNDKLDITRESLGK